MTYHLWLRSISHHRNRRSSKGLTYGVQERVAHGAHGDSPALHIRGSSRIRCATPANDLSRSGLFPKKFLGHAAAPDTTVGMILLYKSEAQCNKAKENCHVRRKVCLLDKNSSISKNKYLTDGRTYRGQILNDMTTANESSLREGRITLLTSKTA